MSSSSVPLGDLVDITSGFAFSSKNFSEAKGTPIIRIRDVARGYTELRFDGDFDKKFLAQNDDLLVSMDGEFRVAEWRGGPALINQRVCKIEPKNGKLDRRFLRHFLPKELKEIEDKTPFVTVKHLSAKTIREIECPNIGIDEQRRIAAILDKADAIRRKRQQALALADDFLKSVFLEMFGDPATSGSYGDLGPHIDFVTSGSRGWARYYAKTGSRFIRSLDVQMNYIADEDAVFVNPPSSAETDRCRVEVGDVLLTITGSKIGRVADVRELIHETYISQHVAIIRLKKSLLPEFVSFFLSLPSLGQRQIEKLQYGQAKPGLNLSQIREFQLPIPTMDKQTEFLKILETTRKNINKLQFQLTESESLFASLSQRAFRGEL